jgi:antitoxin component YwqK of YwqJK toxin-antitoxin module
MMPNYLVVYINGRFEGVYKEFYENGKLHYLINYKNGVLHGVNIEFYKNNFPKFDMYYSNGMPYGVQYIYFENDSARIKSKLLIGEYKKQEVLISKKEFDKNGDLIFERNRVKTKKNRDTLNIGEILTVKFKLEYPEFDRYRIHIGNFNRNFKLIDSTNYILEEGVGNEVDLFFKTSEVGRFYIRGYMEDFKIINKTDSTFETIGTLNNWFDIEYFVK